MPSKKRFFGGLVGANPLRSGSFQDPGAVDRVSSNEGVLSIDTAGPEKATSSTTTVILPDYTTYSETQFTASNAEAGDNFGVACDMSGDGTITVFGAPFEDGATNTLSSSGAVYVYENGTEVAILRASDAETGGSFGRDVAISKDGSTIAVGSPSRSSGGTYFSDGAVYVYEKPTNGWTTTSSEDARLTHTPTDDSQNLGQGVVISDNGDTVVAISDPGSNSPTDVDKAHVYEKPTNGWASTSSSAILTASNGDHGDNFGSGLVISGDGSVIAIGAPDEDTTQTSSGTVYVYERPTNGWATSTEDHFLGAPTRTFGGEFGVSCSLNEDGTVLAVGEWGYSSTGRVHVLEYSGSSWSHSAILTGSSGYTGTKVDVSRDGTTVAASNPKHNSNEGAVYVWLKPSSGWANSSYHRLITAANGATNDYLGGDPGGSFKYTHGLTLTNDGGKVLASAQDDDDGGTDSGSGFLFAATTTVPSSTTTTTTTQTPQWFWGGLRGRDAIVAGSGAVGDDKSLRFDGTNDYLLGPALTAATGGSDSRRKFTISAWVRIDSSATTTSAILGARYLVGGSHNQQVRLAVPVPDYRVSWIEYDFQQAGDFTAKYTSPDNAVSPDTWHHIVCQVDTTSTSDKVTIWVDGTPQTLTATHTYALDADTQMSRGTWQGTSVAQKLTVGGTYDQASNTIVSPWSGQLAEVHFIDGTAYDASYFGETRDGVWVPKEVTGLTYGNNGFYLDFAGNDTGVTLLLDGSSTNDVAGLSTVTPSASGYTTNNTSGAKYIDFQNSGYFNVAFPSALGVSNEPFTVETWVYFDAISNDGVFQLYQSGSSLDGSAVTHNASIAVAVSSSKWTFYDYGANTTNLGTSATGNWYHVAVVYDGTNLVFYVDGVALRTIARSMPAGGWTSIGIGGYYTTAYVMDGRLEDFRVIKGYARYSGSFTPPTAALTNTPEYLGDFGVDRTTDGTGVTLLLDGSGGGTSTITDNSSVGNTVTNVSSGVSNTNITGPYGSSMDVLSFDGTNDRLEFDVSTIMQLSGDFTIETWMRRANNSSRDCVVNYWGVSGDPRFRLEFEKTTDNVTFYDGTSDLNFSYASTNADINDTWFHLAVTRSGSTYEVFIDGTSLGTQTGATTTFTGNASESNKAHIGSLAGSQDYFGGQMADFRITKGYARYSGSFTPPTSALTNDDTWDKPKNNFSVEGNITPDDQLLDTPNLRFATWDTSTPPSGTTLSNGNLTVTHGTTLSYGNPKSTLSMSNGKYYFECHLDAATNAANYGMMVQVADTGNDWLSGFYTSSGAAWTGVTSSTYGTGNMSVGGIVGVALNADTGTTWFSVNGVWQNGATSSGIADGTDTNYAHTLLTGPFYFAVDDASGSNRGIVTTANFGQDHTFAGQKPALLTPYSDANGAGEFYYQPPSGFLALADNYVVTDSLATTGVLSVSEMLQASL